MGLYDRSKTLDDMDEPPKVPMTTRTIQKSQPQKDSLTDAFVTAIVKAFSPVQPSIAATETSALLPWKKLDLRRKNLAATSVAEALRG